MFMNKVSFILYTCLSRLKAKENKFFAEQVFLFCLIENNTIHFMPEPVEVGPRKNNMQC